MMNEYWVNVYKGIPVYYCSTQPTKKSSIEAMEATDYDHPIYRLHIKLKPIQRLSQIPKYEKFSLLKDYI